MHIHFIAIGGAVMHNLAIALHKKGYTVSGSDDEIFDPSFSRLKKYGLLPEKWGWHPDKITGNLDAIILGMHARKDNPELKKALAHGLKIYSFPEYLSEQTKNKIRVVIAGSHGKTTITSMIMHVLKDRKIPFDYMVGSQLKGFETMVELCDESKIAIFEGDEYLSSPLDPRPKFIHYQPYLTLISGIAWDHMNVFPEYQGYKKQFLNLCQLTDPEGKIFYYEGDPELKEIIQTGMFDADVIPYSNIKYTGNSDGTLLHYEGKDYNSSLIGKYNIENLTGAMKICQQLGIEPDLFLESIQTFSGAARRQELIFRNENLSVYHDFAHAPSKVSATVNGFREAYPHKKLIAILELHTFSSLNKDFIPLYKGSLKNADEAILFFDPAVVKHKNLPELHPSFIQQCFNKDNLEVLTDSTELELTLRKKINEENSVILVMSSGNLGGIKLKKIIP